MSTDHINRSLLELYEDGPCGFHSLNDEGIFIHVNDTELGWLEYSREELLGKKRFVDVLTEESAAIFKRNFTRLKEGSTVRSREFQIQSKSGVKRYIIASVFPVFNSDNKFVDSRSISIDVTDRIIAEASLKKSEARLRGMIDFAVDAIILTKQDGIIIDANIHAEELSGFTREEIIGKNVSVFFSKEELARVPIQYNQLCDGNVLRSERCLSCKNGSLVAIETNTKILPDGTVQTFIRDITERKKIENALRVSEEKFSKAFRTSPDSISINRLSDGVYLEVNDGFLALSGYTAAEVLGKSTKDLAVWTNEEDRDGLIAGLKADGIITGFEAPFRRKNGSIIYGMMSARLIEISGQMCILTITRDITEKRKTEDALRNAQKIESLGVLAGGIAHDFNNLLSGIFGYLDLSRHQITEGKSNDALNSISSAMMVFERSKALTQQLLTFSKGGVPFKKVLSLEPIVTNSAKFALSGSNIRLELNLPDTLWHCEIDENQIGQVVDNIIINALQAMPAGGNILISGRNRGPSDKKPAVLARDNYVEITIQDSGIGIPAEILPRIFDPFFTTKQKGSGLGLAIAYSIVKRHEGIIEVESTPGKGASFRFYLGASFKESKERIRKPIMEFRGSGKILIMDDEEFILTIASKMIEEFGFTALTSTNGEEAVEITKTAKEAGDPVLLAILDLTIPGGRGGAAIIQQLLTIDPSIKAIVSSGYSDDPIMADPHRYGFAARLSKPYRFEEMGQVFQMLLEK
jgi:two-component system, cell cycle sensor histidine kinase and response regulator CckA